MNLDRLRDFMNDPGRRIGKYEIVRQIGEGGMGVVYEAIDEKLIKRVAIKCPKFEFRRRVSPEALSSLSITHENVCRVLAAPEEAGDLAVVYEHVEAEPLRSLQSWANLRSLCFPIGVSLRIVTDVLRALDHIHRTHAGSDTLAVFGGVSPDSVLLSRDGLTQLCDPLVSSCATLLEELGRGAFGRVFLVRGELVPVGTVSITTYFHAASEELAAEDITRVLAVADARIFHRSYGDQHGELWSPSGRLLATTTQIAYFKA